MTKTNQTNQSNQEPKQHTFSSKPGITGSTNPPSKSYGYTSGSTYKSSYKSNYSKGPLTINLPEYVIEPDLERLKTLLNYRSHSKSKVQEQLRDYLYEYFESKKGVIAEIDDYGNLYVTKGKSNLYPCVVAHLDINQAKVSDYSIIVSGDWMFGWNNQEGETCGLGFDDKAGVAAALEIFDRVDIIKLFFPLDEEIGLLGTYRSDETFFLDCSMLLQGDRRSFTDDFITYTNGRKVCSKEFVDQIKPIMEKYGYSENTGVATDIGGLKANSKIKCVAANISIGYYSEHSDHEVLRISKFKNAINFMYEVISKHGLIYYEYVEEKLVKMYPSKSSPSAGVGRYSELLDEDDYFDSYYDAYGNGEYISPYAKKYNFDSVNLPKQFTPTDPVFDEWVSELYPEYKEKPNRENLIHYFSDTESFYPQYSLTQEDIDDYLEDGMCPTCYEPIDRTNKLLLNLNCNHCASVFNMPEDAGELFYQELFDAKDKKKNNDSQLELF